MTLLEPTPGLFLLILALVFLLMLAGRMVTTHNSEANTYTTPFHCLLVGCGLWYMWFLLFGTLVGASLKITWWLFLATNLALLFGLTRAFRGVAHAEHFWTKIITTVLLLTPAIWWAGSDLPIHYDEFWHTLKNVDHMLYLNNIFGGEDVVQFGIAQAHLPLATSSTTLPVHLLGGQFIPATFALFNLILLAAASGGLTQAADIRVRWSNLPWVAGGALMGVTLFNPFFQGSTILAGTFDIPLAVALLGLFFPLLRSAPLPTGWAVLPTALIGAWLVGMTPYAFIYVITAFILWFARSIIEFKAATDKPKPVFIVFGMALLALIPAFSWVLWQHYVLQTPIPQLPSPSTWNLAEGLISAFLLQPLVWLLALGILMGTTRALITDVKENKLGNLLTTQSWYIVPSLLLLVTAALWLAAPNLLTDTFPTAQSGVWRTLASLQFVLLLPLWQLYRKWYAHSPLKTFAFKSPWVVGLICCALMVIAQIGNERRFKSNFNISLSHTMQVAASMRENYVQWGQKVAVVDSHKVGDFYATVLGFGLRNHATVEPITGWLEQAQGKQAALHQALVQKGFSHVWIHAPNDLSRRIFHSQLKADRSYLFELAPNHIKLVATYPHLRYTEPLL